MLPSSGGSSVTEKRKILKGIVWNGDSIAEALEKANLDQLRTEGEDELADLITRLLFEVDRFSWIIGLYNQYLCDEVINEEDS
jgi:hypothetical protein